MAIAPCGTFDYVGTVPAAGAIGLAMPLRLRTPVPVTGDRLQDDRLLGPEVILTVEESTTPGRVSLVLRRPPESPFSTLFRSPHDSRRVTQVSLDVDADVTAAWRPGDRVQFCRDQAASLAFGLLRRDAVVVALGDIALLELGPGIELYWELPVWFRSVVPPDEFERLFGTKRVATSGDPDGEKPDPRPLIVVAREETVSLTKGQSWSLDGLHVHVLACFDPNGTPIGASGYVVVWRDDVISSRAALASARLEPFSMTHG
jgi:hypothetical protein